jgi:ParB-like chromosome segregation protein Spo0J
MMQTEIEGNPDPALHSRISHAPVSTIKWVPLGTLKPNDYNPNSVAPAELELLIVSIVEDGFTQPIVVLPDRTIVDGFHRYMVSSDPRIWAIYGGLVPIVHVDVDPVHRRMSTIRHNRARGVHGVVPMASIVRAMLAEGVSVKDMQDRLGMEDEEVARLADRAGMPERMRARGSTQFGQEWVPSRDA